MLGDFREAQRQKLEIGLGICKILLESPQKFRNEFCGDLFIGKSKLWNLQIVY